MRKPKLSSALNWLLVAAMPIATGCLSGSDGERPRRVTIEIPPATSTRPMRLAQGLSDPTQIPATANDVHCIGVNVTGPGISAASGAAADCSAQGTAYLGIYAGLVSGASGGSLTVEVPAGPARTIHVFGIQTSSGSCPADAVFFDALAASPASGAPLELGAATLDLYADQTITVSSTWNASAPRIAYCTNQPAYALFDAASWDSGTWAP